MKRSRRNILVGLGLSFTTLAVPISWVKPIVNVVTVPAHADTSPIDPPDEFEPPSVYSRNVECVTGDPNVLGFELCSREVESVTFFNLGEPSAEYAEHISPPLPFVLPPGECAVFSVQATDPTIFDCTPENSWSVSYYAENESGTKKGITGAAGVDP